MKCPTCAGEQERSRVFEDGSRSTLMYFAPYYDEDGNHHIHDRNTTTSHFHCSRGHHWTDRSKGSCWCGWSA